MRHWRGRDRGEAAMWPWGRDCSWCGHKPMNASDQQKLYEAKCMSSPGAFREITALGHHAFRRMPPELWQNKIYAILSLRVYDNLLQPPQKIHMCRIQCMNLKCTILHSFLMYCSNFFHSLSYATYCHYSLTFEPQKTVHAKALGQDRKWLVWGTGGKPVCQEPGEPHGT